MEFCYDATVTGRQSTGAWTAYKHPMMQRFIRDIIYVLQQRHGPQALEWTHIYAHQGHWWNEVADVLAKHANEHPSMVQNSDLIYTFLDSPGIMQALDWIWALEAMKTSAPSMPHIFDNHLYHFRTMSDSASPFHCHFGDNVPRSKKATPTSSTSTLKVATLNVLTLDTKGDKQIGTGSGGRHLMLLQQCHQQGLHLVGVQETRAIRATNRNNPWYHVVHAPCRQDGHYGVQIWVHRSLSFCPGMPPFSEDDYRIIWSSYNVLAVKISRPALRCIVFSARAPTSDKPLSELQAFWNTITAQILHKFPGWKILLLCDSNSHVGSCPSTSISTGGAEQENQAGTVFHEWLLANDLWLPSTWEHIHQGDHHTYVTPAGHHHHRLDFVGLSHNWPLDFVATSVDFDIDASMSRYTTLRRLAPSPPLHLQMASRHPGEHLGLPLIELPQHGF